jgi:GNAT superfamily N-acetyltransferase
MIFYSDKIEADIIDNNDVSVIADMIDQFKEDIDMLFTYFTFSIIGLDYIKNILKFQSNRVAFYCLEDVFDIRKCTSAMIYSKQTRNTGGCIIYYIMMICTQPEYKKMGFATKLLNGFVEKVRKETENANVPVKIILSSLDDVVSYYQKYGFEVVDCSMENYPYLASFEKYDETKIYTIMEFVIKP